tara:strand:- start:1010 stop:1639 length:630 start_codon:yes stop_codon:yes gene_type:complete
MSSNLEKYIIEVVSDKKNLISEGLQFHIKENIPISTSIYRRGSSKYFELFNEARFLYNEGAIELTHEIDEMYIKELEVGKWAQYEGQMVPLDYPFLLEDYELENDTIAEAEYQGKKVKLGKAGVKRAGKGKAVVFVNSGKKDKKGRIKVKKVTFGSSMPMAMGKSEKHRKRRKSFGDRHQCHKKKDKTKAGYWSCRATKLFGRNIPGWW